MSCHRPVSAATKKYVEYFNGHKMPIVGLGTFLGTSEEMERSIETAIDVGYRHIDTAFAYRNEKAIGNILQKLFKANKVKREDLFIVSKLPPNALRASDVHRFLKMSLDDLQLDYVDLYLVHSPIGMQNIKDDNIFPSDAEGNSLLDKTTDHVAIWKKLEEQVDLGLARSIGLSNFNIKQIQRVLDNARIQPANLQVECNAYFQQRELFDFCKSKGITFTAYAPIGSPGFQVVASQLSPQKTETPNLLSDPALKPLAEKHKKTVSQVLLRWLIQRDIVVIPKSTNPGRIAENFNVFDFKLSVEDTKVIDGLDRNYRMFHFNKAKNAVEHPEFPYEVTW